MIALDPMNLKTFMNQSIQEVFETMLSMELLLLNETPDLSADGDRIVGSVGFAGDVMGNVRLHVTYSYARRIAADMIGLKPEEIENDEEIHDVIGELSNMIGGGLKSRLCDSGYLCELSIPSVTSGQNFNIESKGWAIRENVSFSFENHAAFVELSVKPGDKN